MKKEMWINDKKPYKFKTGDIVYWWDKTDRYVVEGISDEGSRENRYWIYLEEKPDFRMDTSENDIRGKEEFLHHLDNLMEEKKLQYERDMVDFENKKKIIQNEGNHKEQ